jgi:hypothetical protein
MVPQINSASTDGMVMDEIGGPILAPPPETTLKTQLHRLFMLHVFFPSVLPLLLLNRYIKGKISFSEMRELHRLVWSANADPIDKNGQHQDKELLRKVYQLKSAKEYVERGALEWQEREGYCAPTTLRCILKSFDDYPTHVLPPAKRGPSDPAKWCQAIRDLAEEKHETHVPKMHTDVIRGSVDYETFLASIRKVNDPKSRVAINFLRPALFGFLKPWWIPIHYFFGIFAGHFSPVIGILENDGPDPLVAVFDVNHRYGCYLVPAPRLYESVKAKDIMTHESRAIIIVSEDK